jgi:hypothetical protein
MCIMTGADHAHRNDENIVHEQRAALSTPGLWHRVLAHTERSMPMTRQCVSTGGAPVRRASAEFGGWLRSCVVAHGTGSAVRPVPATSWSPSLFALCAAAVHGVVSRHVGPSAWGDHSQCDRARTSVESTQARAWSGCEGFRQQGSVVALRRCESSCASATAPAWLCDTLVDERQPAGGIDATGEG